MAMPNFKLHRLNGPQVFSAVVSYWLILQTIREATIGEGERVINPIYT